ncbi:hypothetical protein ACSHWB_00240 [Lentzea sp. HUAS TT2]|uniref:hypothetical protein n=1 Tax=Lentzea sp. HUAS TT2 TaxID=3447454 RepID=UPI003F725396
MKVVLASCDRLPFGDGDEESLVAALRRDGVDVEWQPWGGAVEADLVVLRTTWDYPDHLAEFLTWCESVPGLANPLPVVRWNIDKSYMAELAAHGVPVVPTTVVQPGEDPAFPDGEFVVKPAVGAGSRGAGRFTDHAAARAHLTALGVKALVQPYQSTVDENGETALVFFAGEYSHSFHKGPMLAQGLAEAESGLYVEERLGSIEPSPGQVALAEQVLDVAAELLSLRRSDFLYARVDVVEGADGEPLLLELELTEPSLGFKLTTDEAASRFSKVIQEAASRG